MRVNEGEETEMVAEKIQSEGSRRTNKELSECESVCVGLGGMGSSDRWCLRGELQSSFSVLSVFSSALQAVMTGLSSDTLNTNSPFSSPSFQRSGSKQRFPSAP